MDARIPTNEKEPESDGLDGMDPPSTPLRGTKEERRVQKMQKTVKHRVTRESDALAEKTAKIAEKEELLLERKRAKDRAVDAAIENTLEFMKGQGLAFGNMLARISEPQSVWRRERYERLFSSPTRIRAILDAWTAPQNPPSFLETIDTWVMEYVCRKATQESNEATISGVLLSHRKDVDEEFATKESLAQLYKRITTLCPRMYRILTAFCMPPRQQSTTPNQLIKKDKVGDTR